MRTPRTPRRPLAKATAHRAPESFILKSTLVASALFVAAFVMVELEFHVSAPGHSLSETETTPQTATR
jgi:magnesium-transporting ATPase (P-type)